MDHTKPSLHPWKTKYSKYPESNLDIFNLHKRPLVKFQNFLECALCGKSEKDVKRLKLKSN